MFVFKKYDRQNHVWSFKTKYLRFLCIFTSWSGETPTGIDLSLDGDFLTGNFSDTFLSWTKNFNAFINIVWVSTVFSTPYLFLDTAARLQWPVTQISRSQQFFLLIRLFKYIVVFRNGHKRTIPLLFDLYLKIRKCPWDGEYSHTLFNDDRWKVYSIR
jgi:hypothetical protein